MDYIEPSTMQQNFQKVPLIKKALNKISSYVTQTEDFGLGDLALKYPRTPANILARAIDYSPIGVAISMLKIMTDKDARDI